MGVAKKSEKLARPDDADHFRLWRDTKRTAVLGLASSGKSVFLTSVIDRLNRSHGKTTSSFFGKSTWHFDRLPPYEADGGFPVNYYREHCLANQLWPDKTVATSQYRYRFYRTAAGLRRRIDDQYAEERTFIDLPGERLADFAMAGRSYAGWSDALFGEIEGKRHYFAFAQDYLELMNTGASGGLDEQDVLTAYKKVLARFTRRLVPLVTPSTFLVHEKGLYPKKIDPPANELEVEQLVQRGVCGLDEASEFAPLSAIARQANRELAERFEQRFNAYRVKLAEPVAAGFYACEHLLILVDVAAILEGSPALYHSTRRSLQKVFEYLDPGRSGNQLLVDLARHLISGGREGVSKVNKIGLIATKADCVHRLDRPNLLALLKHMTKDLLEDALRQRWLNVEYFYCAAIRATEDDEYPYLSGWLLVDPHDPDSVEYRKFAVSSLPSSWPAESRWEQTEYTFAQPLPPKLDLLGEKPFPSIGMDEVMRFIGWGGV
jgi:predicted YcjX-like family ATPase